MEVVNEMRLTFLSRSTNEAFARGAIASFVMSLDPTIEELTDIKTAVSEAVTNCIVHAYREELGRIYIQVRILQNQVVQIKIKDKGCGIPDIEKAREPLFTTAPEGERAGLGFAVMESFMDKLRVTSKVGAGTIVTMEKKMSRRPDTP